MVKKSKHSMDLNFEVEKKLQDMGIDSPHLFLCEIMAGHDPRGTVGRLYQYVKEASKGEDIESGLPSKEFWDLIKELVLNDPVYYPDPVSLSDSTAAAKEVLMYMHPKRKAIEVSGDLEHLVKVVPLSKEEIDAFEKRFNDEF